MFLHSLWEHWEQVTQRLWFQDVTLKQPSVQMHSLFGEIFDLSVLSICVAPYFNICIIYSYAIYNLFKCCGERKLCATSELIVYSTEGTVLKKWQISSLGTNMLQRWLICNQPWQFSYWEKNADKRQEWIPRFSNLGFGFKACSSKLCYSMGLPLFE